MPADQPFEAELTLHLHVLRAHQGNLLGFAALQGDLPADAVDIAVAGGLSLGGIGGRRHRDGRFHPHRSEEHTSELQSLMRISYAVFCLKKKKEKPDVMMTYKAIRTKTLELT